MRPLVFATILATLAAFPVAAQAPANTKAAPKAPLPAPSAALSENEMRSRQLLVDALSDKNPDRLYIWESTARGYTMWYPMWNEARADPLHCKCIFLGWWSKDSQRIDRHDKDWALYGDNIPPSKDEQRKRFLSRIDEPEKNWKFSAADLEERKYWDDYMDAYEKCLGETSTDDSPWYVVPADDKENARLIVSQTIVETMEALNMTYPETSPARRKELLRMRRQLLK